MSDDLVKHSLLHVERFRGYRNPLSGPLEKSSIPLRVRFQDAYNCRAAVKVGHLQATALHEFFDNMLQVFHDDLPFTDLAGEDEVVWFEIALRVGDLIAVED